MRVSASDLRSRGPLLLSAAWVAAHLPFIVPSLEDIDSINFALGLHDFDPARHQPHPPGYPVYIALVRVALAALSPVLPSWPVLDRDALALAACSVVAGAVALVGAVRLFGTFERSAGPGEPTAAPLWAAVLLACAPLFWLTGLRPMSDMVGLAATVWAQALMFEHRVDRRRWIGGALLAGIAGGIRIQTVVLTAPVLAWTLWQRGVRLGVGPRDGRAWHAAAAYVIGTAAWVVPLVILTGGVDAYVAATRTQTAEIVPVEMLLSNPTPRRAAFALYESFVLPWASIPLAVVVGTTALLGGMLSLKRQPSGLIAALVAFAPYAIYHVAIQETVTVRYALPILPLVAWLTIQALTVLRGLMPLAAGAIVVACLLVAVPGGVRFGAERHPAFVAIDAANRAAVASPPLRSFSHYQIRRPLQAAASSALHVVDAPRNYEWLGPVQFWREGGSGPVWFFADPKRTDLALIDPQSRRNVLRYRWPAADRPELSGTRPLGVDWYQFQEPGWFAGEGWSLTPETGGIAQASNAGPDHRAIEAWIRRRNEPMRLMVGGRHLGNPADPDAQFELAIDGVVIDRWRLAYAERNFLRFLDLPAGIPGPGSYGTVTIRSRSLDASRPAATAIRQFDAQDASTLMVGFGEGWYEDEYAPESGLRWRWSSRRSVLRLRGTPAPVRITLRGESPLKYVSTIPTVHIRAGDRVLGELRPSSDFEWTVDVPVDAWVQSGGDIAVETDQIYFPGAAEGTADERQLGLRLFECRVDPVSP